MCPPNPHQRRPGEDCGHHRRVDHLPDRHQGAADRRQERVHFRPGREAALRAMHCAGVTADQLDLIVIATITPDMPFPSTACLVQRKIGAHRAAAFDLEAACSGFIYGLEIAQQFIMSRTYDTVLVIGAEKLSSIVDWKDRNTCVLFGDGAGRRSCKPPQRARLATAVMGADGRKADLLFMAGGGSRCPASAIRSPRACTFCAWKARRPSRTPFKPCRPPPRRPCAAAKSISPASSASSPTRPTAASSMPLANALAPARAALHQPSQIWQHLRCFRGHCAG